jgi:hypothetical protein
MSKKLKLDPNAKPKTPGKPAFLSKPKDAPVYHGFPLLPDTEIDGWVLGTITEFEDPEGCEYGDAFVQAPDGSRAGLVWSVGNYETNMIIEPDENRWGVYEIAFPKVVYNIQDLKECFRHILPELKMFYRKIYG